MEVKSPKYNPLKTITGMMRFFIVCGVWPIAKRFRWLYAIYSLMFHLVFHVFYISCKFLNFFFETNVALLSVGFFIFLAELSLVIRIINLLANFEKVLICLKMVADFRIYDENEGILMNKHLSSFSTVMKCYLSAGTSACIFSWIAPLLSSEPMLPYPSWYPLDWKNDQPSYWISYSYQVVTTTFQVPCIILLQLLPVYFLAVIGAQLDILKCRLEGLGNTEKEMFPIKSELELVDCVVIHNGILSFCMVFLFEIFLACYFGNEIILGNAMLSFALYSSNWINLSPKFKKNMVMFLEALKRPTMLKTGKIFKLTLESFLIVINRSYSLFAVLQNTLN
ncbi:hypothetical protein HA402_004449 [Bradysia odoriphaga]|nr:hypothetical protein HA402_004449 [Bradysia odoriphaga]